MYIDEKHDDWDIILPYVTFAYNSAIQATIGYSPYFLLYGREPLTIHDTLLKYPEDKKEDYDEYIQNILKTSEEARIIATQKTLDSQKYNKEIYDSKHRQAVFSVNDLVWLWSPTRKIGRSDKFQRNYYGPYKIIKKTSSVNYLIEPVEGKKKEQLVHVSRLKPYMI